MKKFTLIIGIMLILEVMAQAQDVRHFSGGFYGGVIGSQIDGDAQYGFYHGGFNLGGTVQYPVSNKLFLSLEIAFAQKGAHDKQSPGYPSLYHININYIDIPLLLHFYDRKAFGFYGGFQYSRLVGSPTEYIDPIFESQGYQGVTIVNNDDYEAVFGGSYYFTPNISLDIRYCYSMFRMGQSPESYYRALGTYNNLIEARVGYIFGMPFDKKKDKSPK